MKIHLILLAAGNSRRFGRNKLLADISGKPMYLHLADRIENMQTPHAGTKIIVSQYREILERMADRGYLSVYNPDADRGISGSIRLGICALRESGIAADDAVCFFVCDQPYFRRESMEEFFEAYMHSEKGIGCAGHGSTLGNPVIFSVSYLEELLALTGDSGGKKVVRRHMEDVFVYEVKEQELEDIDYEPRPFVVVRGGGDLATGTICRLHRDGYRLLVLETAHPACIRRQVSLCEAVYDGTAEVEGVKAVRIRKPDERIGVWADGRIPVLVDETGSSIAKMKPDVVIDAIIAKKNLGTDRRMAALTIALGPGFMAGEDVDAVIETMRGETLGKVYREGAAIPNTGIPGMVGGYAKERVIHAPSGGVMRGVRKIGDTVTRGEVIAYVGDTPVYASLTGIVRGMIREGFAVKKGLKIIDIDPRTGQKEQCFRISDKAERIAESVSRVIRQWEEERRPLYERLRIDLQRHRVISVVGAGGKTTLIYRLAEELAALGYRVIVTTTTHMQKPKERFCEYGQPFSLRPGEYVTIGISCDNGKITGTYDDALSEQADFVLIEADGSRRMPLKVPAAHEPVIPDKTELIIGVLGYNSVGQPISAVSHRAQDTAGFLGKKISDIVTEEDLAKITESERGLRKGVHGRPFRAVWNQWTEKEEGQYESCNHYCEYIRIQRIQRGQERADH